MPIHTGTKPSDACVAHAHVVRFYDDDSLLLEEAAGFLQAALGAGGAAVLIATPAHVQALRERCAQALDGAADRMVCLDAEQALAAVMVDGWPDPDRFAASFGGAIARAGAAGAAGGPVHLFGDAVGLLCERGQHEAAIELERLGNALATRLDFASFCAYPWRVFPNVEYASAFEQVCAQHQHAATHAHDGAAHDISGQSFDAEVVRRQEAERALRQREQDLADFVENAVEGLHRVGPDGIIQWANKAELQMLGYEWDEYVGRHIAEFHVDPEVIADIIATLMAGGTLIDKPARLRCKDGSIKHVLIHSNGSFENGRLRYTRCFTRDATARHERDEALARCEQLLAELTIASRAKDDFLAMLGHELRNPLAPIVTALQLMRLRGNRTPEQDIIGRQVEHLIRLVDDLLDVSRVTRGTIELQVQRVDIAQVADKAVEMTSTLLQQRGHALRVEVEPGLLWEGDPVRLAQVLANLLTNAARYTPPGGQILLRAGADGADALRISVADNGIGLSAEMHEQVFELFFQGKRSVDRAEGGLGIGLALVKNIVELHGGTVKVLSEGKGRGSEFVVRLPRRAVHALPDLPASVGEAAAAGKRRRIMVVDDNVDAATLLGSLLDALGHEVEVYHEPLAALAAAGRFRPDTAVLDIGLPVLDGYELATRMRALLGEQACRLVALTGYGQPADKARSLASGFDRHLVKPITPDEVARLLETWPAV